MKTFRTAVICAIVTAWCHPALAQFGGLVNKAQKVEEGKKKFDALNITDEEEAKIGADVSQKVRTRFGVVQDKGVHKYITEVGLLLAQESGRPNLPWKFIVLDTNGVNAFAAPGGYVHITRGALGLIKSEAELASVLAHEIGHVAHKHTVDAIRKANGEKMLSDATLADRGPYLNQLANYAYDMVLEGKFSRDDELDADKLAASLTPMLGYAPGALADFLTRLDERNKDMPTRNGLFASHPDTKERITKIRQLAKGKNGASVEPRYASNVKYTVPAVTEIAVVAEGTKGLTGSDADNSGGDEKKQKPDDKDKKTEEQPKRGFGLGALAKNVNRDQQSTQVASSGGARGVGPDRLAKGGDNPAIVAVTVTPEELAAFKRGIS